MEAQPKTVSLFALSVEILEYVCVKPVKRVLAL